MKTKTKIIILIALVLVVLLLSSTTINSQEEINLSNSENVSNKKIGWGLKRNSNHEQPDVGSENREVLEKNNGICLGNSEKKLIYLTFDEGYEAGYTKQILETLKANNVKAAFFITAHYLNTEKELVKQMIDEGHIVGNHTPKCLMSGNDIEVKC